MTGMDVFAPFLTGIIAPVALLVVLVLVANLLSDAIRTHADPNE